MGMRSCPKCNYMRKAADKAVPDWQCPGRGIAYDKYVEQPAAPSASRLAAMSAPAAAPMSAKALFFILAGLVAVGYVGYERLLSPKAKEQQAAAGGEILEASNPAFYGTMEPGGPVLRMKPETLAQLNKMTPSRIVMFGTSWCPYCAKARALFKEQGVRYSELDLEKDSAAAAFQKDVMGLSGFPTIVIGNRVTQGFDEGQIVASLKEL